MQNCTEYLLELGKKVTSKYTEWEGTKAIALGASISKNQATNFSDIDIMMIYDEIPSDEFMDQVFKENGGTNRKILNKSENGCLELYYVNGVECQFSHSLKDFYEEVVVEVLEKHSIEPMIQLVADGFQTVIPLYGVEYINGIKAKLKEYPEELALKLAERYLRFGPYDELRYRFQKEDNIIWNRDVISIFIKRILSTLLAVNRKYIPGDFRKIKPVIEDLQFKPDDLYHRIMKLYTKKPIEVIEDLYNLTIEVIELVKIHLPEFDLSKVEKIFHEPQKGFEVKKLS